MRTIDEAASRVKCENDRPDVSYAWSAAAARRDPMARRCCSECAEAFRDGATVHEHYEARQTLCDRCQRGRP